MRPPFAFAVCLLLACTGGALLHTALVPAPAQAEEIGKNGDPYMKAHRLNVGKRIISNDSGLSTGGRIQVEDSPSALAAKEEALREQAKKMAAKAAKDSKVPAAAQGAVPCQNLESLLKIIVGQRRLGYLADAVDNSGTVHMWFVSNSRREWASITVEPDLTACIVAEGNAWNYALEPMKIDTGAEAVTEDPILE